jgi:hypothetical protein
MFLDYADEEDIKAYKEGETAWDSLTLK